MRYYDIAISDPATGKLVRQFKSTQANGLADPGALNIELDLPVTMFAMPASSNDSACYCRVWGIPLAEIGQATDYGFRPGAPDQPGKHIVIRGGMQKGLPLANPAQQGVLVEGQIWQAFGNWIGVNMTLDMMILPDGGSPMRQELAKNLSFSWPAGTPLSSAIEQTLRTAFPGYRIDMQISRITRPNDEKSVYHTITEFARSMRELSANNYAPRTDFSGVQIALRGKRFTVTDGTSEQAPKEIKFTDLVGQPTWVAPATIQVTTVMRGDIDVADWIKLPPGPAFTTPQAAINLRQKTAFAGVFRVIRMHHYGNFRQPDGTAWVTTLDAIEQGAWGGLVG